MALGIETWTALRDRAHEAVAALDEGRDPGPLPEFEPGWNDAFVGAIQEFKGRFRGSKDLQRLLRITGELLYGKDIHWAMELVQNAEDAGSTRVAFVFEPDRVLVWNDGVPFTSGDTWAICSAGHSAKRNKIGFFGIGFKSVYKLTAAPEIYSGPFALRIEDKLYPTPLPLRRAHRGAWFVLPVLPVQRPKLPGMVASIAGADFAQVLLTLTSLSEIRVIDRTGSGMSGRFMRRLSAGDPARGWDECEIRGTWPGLPVRRWRRFFYQTAAVPEGVSREGRSVEAGDSSVVILARAVGDPSAELRLHCFLPTSVRSELCWLVQADFEPNASREQLRDSLWNRWLMGEVGLALARAVNLSARSIGEAPWDLIPLTDEVRDPLQRVAFDIAQQELREAKVVVTRQGWRRPAESTWGYYPGIMEVVREGDLPVATESDVSYVRQGVMGPVVAESASRAEQVLEAFGASPVACAELIRLLGSDDSLFRRVRRDPQWWLAALRLIARHGNDDDKRALALTACLPIRGGGRVRPSPTVADDGYLVAFSQADISEDLRAFLGESEVFLIEPHLSPRSEGRRRETRSEADIAAVREVAAMLEASPFNVAIDAGAYHVVGSLVIPRMNSLEAAGALSAEQVTRAWRLFEYVRQKWPTYVSEYRRRRTDRATDAAIAAELGARIKVVATVGSGRGQSRQLRPLSETYLPSALLEFEGMDVALSGDDQVAFVDDVYRDPLKVTIHRRGGRVRGAVPPPVEFLRMLGAPIGPRVVQQPTVQVSPHDIPWVDWAGVPAGARGRVALWNDWEAPDIARFLVRWPSIAERGRHRRGQALLRAIEADWERLVPSARAQPMYFYSAWTHWQMEVASTWVGRLQQVQWLPSASGTLERPTDLVLETLGNRLALGGATRGLLRWRATSPEAVAALGVRARPTPDRVIDTLVALRAGEATASEADTLAIAGACYQSLAEHIREAGPSDSAIRQRIVTRMRGGSGRGLIYAPPPDGVEGERWWAPSRVLQNDAARWVGPYLGQLARRYRAGGSLWEALGIRRDLTAEIACEVIERDLAHDDDRPRAHEYYGRLVAFLEGLPLQPQASFDQPPALTTGGWLPAKAAWWTPRPEVAEAFAATVGWWQPGNRDPSAHRRAASFLGVREVGAEATTDDPLSERWEIRDRAPLEFELEARWHLAVRTWPHMLREDADLSQSEAVDALGEAVTELMPITAAHLVGRLVFSDGSDPLRASISPAVILRRKDRVVGRTSDDLFSSAAAASIAQLIDIGQRSAARSLALLLTIAAHDPAELEKLAARYAVVGYQHREFTYVPPESDELDAGAAERVQLRSRRGRVSDASVGTDAAVALADPARYGLVATITRVQPAPPLPMSVVPGGLKQPYTDDDPGAGGGSDKAPPAARSRFSNTEIEGAAQPFIAEFELETRGTTITRQGSGVGADFLASDGRYIEVKAFSGEAGISFDLEPTEWRAAQRPGIGDRYWVYVVEHLRDGQPPKITAVLNPVTDDATQKEPTGKLRIRGWKSATTQQIGEFGERTVSVDADDQHTAPHAAGRLE